MSEHREAAIGFVVSLSLVMMAASATIASANPVAPPQWHAESNDYSIIFLLLLVNLPLDLALFATALFGTALALGKNLGKVPREYGNFARLTMLGAFIIAPLGAVIDYCFVYSWDPWKGEFWILFDPLMWFIGTLLIFASIALTYILLLGVTPTVALIPSFAVAAVSPVSWYLESGGGGTFFYGILCGTTWVIGIMIAVLALLGLRNWHRKNFSKENASS